MAIADICMFSVVAVWEKLYAILLGTGVYWLMDRCWTAPWGQVVVGGEAWHSPWCFWVCMCATQFVFAILLLSNGLKMLFFFLSGICSLLNGCFGAYRCFPVANYLNYDLYRPGGLRKKRKSDCPNHFVLEHVSINHISYVGLKLSCIIFQVPLIYVCALRDAIEGGEKPQNG